MVKSIKKLEIRWKNLMFYAYIVFLLKLDLFAVLRSLLICCIEVVFDPNLA